MDVCIEEHNDAVLVELSGREMHSTLVGLCWGWRRLPGEEPPRQQSIAGSGPAAPRPQDSSVSP